MPDSPAHPDHPVAATTALDAPSGVRPTADPLDLAALDIERHVAAAGWDQGTRLFALVPTRELLAAQPDLARDLEGDLGAADLAPGALSAVEQEGLTPGAPLAELFAGITWPPSVHGAAIAVERIVVPPGAERDLPEDPGEAQRALAAHPDRADVRLVVAVTRAGAHVCLLRQRAHDRDDRVASDPQIAPGLVAGLRATFED